jgi:predicted RecB family nuclease
MANMDIDEIARLSLEQYRSYLNCKTKFFKQSTCVETHSTTFAAGIGRISTSYKLFATEHVIARVKAQLIEFDQMPSQVAEPLCDHCLIDCETIYLEGHSLPFVDPGSHNALRSAPDYKPVLFLPGEKPDPNASQLLCFGALGISGKLGRAPTVGVVCYGRDYRVKVVKLSDHMDQTRNFLQEIANLIASHVPPRAILNRHCPTCDYRPQCRDAAVVADDLSLISSLADKDRRKLEAKGITTIGQLSYGYRPRRKKGTRQAGHAKGRLLTSKYDPRLKALAIKKGSIHVVGRPVTNIAGTPIYFDIEGVPDRAEYYLVGIRYRLEGRDIERSFWADSAADECRMWGDFLSVLDHIERPCLVHYGSYETHFLKRMIERYPLVVSTRHSLDEVLKSSVNVLTLLYAQIYFPTFSNGLKEVAQFAGVKWSHPDASGALALLWRSEWEMSHDASFKDCLVTYNLEDCRATEVVADAILSLCGEEPRPLIPQLPCINVDDLQVAYQRTYGKFPATLPQFQAINKAAYWDYQRSKVYVRSDKNVKAAVRRERKGGVAAKPVIDQIVRLENDRPQKCPHCTCERIHVGRREHSKIILDLKFTRSGVRRANVEFLFKIYRCTACGRELKSRPFTTKFGRGIRAWVIYQIIELRMSNQKISDGIATLFGIRVEKTAVNDIKASEAAAYMPLYKTLKQEVALGTLVHADETKGVVSGGGHYIWIFANMSSVLYVYAPSRDGSVLQQILPEFKGVLISDFYAAYDAVDCPQQRCLIHLMRDINDDLVKHPFNDEISPIAIEFGNLLRGIVETIDQHGLKKHFLRKHKLSADRFLDFVSASKCLSDVGVALQKRIAKNRQRLFTFLDHDGVPWNNNNAEHAVRAFTRLRNVMLTSTAKGTSDYCVLLSIQQTLKSRNYNFLDFLRSGDRDFTKWSGRTVRSNPPARQNVC